MAIVGFAAGVPAAVIVNCSFTDRPETADTPLPAAPLVPHPVDGVMLVAT